MSNSVVTAEITFLTPEQGGRSAPPFQGYRPDLVVEDDEGAELTSYLPVALVTIPEKRIPGEPELYELALYTPFDYSAVQEGAYFSLREGPHIIARGRVMRRTER